MREPYRLLDLFSGIGGFSLGLERSGGFKTVAFCEIEPFPRRVLAKHWPEVPIHEDVQTVQYSRGDADVICAGFPCQDISIAGPGTGLAGERSGLWREVVRAVRVVRPKYVCLENVAALLRRGMGRVLGDMAALGYDTEWHCIPAAYVGARHIRDRVWVVANASGDGLERPIQIGDSLKAAIPDDWRPSARASFPLDVESWASEPAFLGKNDDVPAWMDEVNAYGNAVVPQIPELIGRSIMASDCRQA